MITNIIVPYSSFRFRVLGFHIPFYGLWRSYNLNCLKGLYIGDYIWNCYRGLMITNIIVP